MQNILVTGGCGFIGANFIRLLFNEPDFKGRIINVDKLTYAGNPDNLTDVEDTYPDRYVFVRADICDAQAMTGVFSKFNIDAVCNFAAESHVDRTTVEPDAFIKTNIYGTFTLLEAAREFQDQIIRFHHVSTDEVFGSLGGEGYFTEETSYQPNSPCSASKAASDHLIRAYFSTYDLPITISNCSDHCKAVWEIMQRGKPGETYNIGGRCELANLDTVGIICDVLDAIRPSQNNRPPVGP